MKGEIIYKILNTLGEGAMYQADFTNAILRAGYGATPGKIDSEFSKIQNKRINKEIDKVRINKFKKYLSKLKSDGLILEDKSDRIYLSSKGTKKLGVFKNSLYLNDNFYNKKVGDKVVIVSYDIPVAFNRERNMLRDILRMLGFDLIHKSVWVGKVMIPERFVRDLSRLGILDYVEILEVTKSGTLKSRN